MLKLSDFRAYVALCEQSFAEITKSEVVMDDSQINAFLSDIKESDGHVLVGIIPKHNPFGNVDNVQSKDTMSFLILKKVDRSDVTHNEFLNTIEAAQDLTRVLIEKMLLDNLNGGNDCNIMMKLSVNSIDINPIWGLSGCDGYEIDFSLDSNL